jgi:hypothetical protein
MVKMPFVSLKYGMMTSVSPPNSKQGIKNRESQNYYGNKNKKGIFAI